MEGAKQMQEQTQPQTYEGYFESGTFYTAGQPLRLPERCKIYITVFNESEHINEQPETLNWLDKLYYLLEESKNEKLDVKDFPRTNFGRDQIKFNNDYQPCSAVSF